MKKTIQSIIVAVALSAGWAQTPQKPQEPDEIIRITTALVQTDVVVMDKNEKPITDLKLEDFELFENGKRQEIKFMEFVGVDTERRAEGERPAALPAGSEIPRDLSARELKRVIGFVIDDLTIPFEDMPAVREMLLGFVNNQMRDDDLVAIVRVVGGKGLLQQFTTDRQLLRRAIRALGASSNPFMAFNNPGAIRFGSTPTAITAEGGGTDADIAWEEQGLTNVTDPNDETQRLFRGLMSLNTASFVIDSLKEIPGRKSLVLISGGIPIFEVGSTGTTYSNVSYLLNRLTDQAVRAGVVLNTMDPRGLKASPGVSSFKDTPARSALSSEDPTFGRGGGSDQMFGPPLAGAAEHLSLATIAKATGGVSIVNTNDFKPGLDKVLARSSYYLLAYTPAEKFDNKFRRIEIKVKRSDAKVFAHRGYVARTEGASTVARSKEETIAAAAKSPLAKRDLDVSANITIKPQPANKNAVGIHILIDANRLNFTRTAAGKHQASFDIVGFVYDQLGKLRGGFSETVNTNFSPEEYTEALKAGLTYSADTQLPSGYFQIRAVVRDASNGNLGTAMRYLELSDVSKGRLIMGSLFTFAVDPPVANPIPLLAVRRLSQRQELRYAAMIYNAKLKDGKPQLHSQVVISQGSKILFREPEQLVETSSVSPAVKIGQLGLAKVPPGRYVLTLIITDTLGDKKTSTLSRSIDFTVTN